MKFSKSRRLQSRLLKEAGYYRCRKSAIFLHGRFADKII